MLMVSSSSFLLSQSILESGVCALNLVSPIIIKGKSCNRLVSPSSSLLLCSASPSTSSQKNQSSSSSSSSWAPSSELSFESRSTLLPDHDEEELLTGWSYIPSQTSHTGSVRKEEETNQRVENSIPKLSDILTSLDTNEKNPKKSGKDVFFDNNKNKKASLCDEKRIPWKADFVTSRKTQAKLKKIMIVNNSEAVATADPSFSHHHQEQKKLNNLSNCVQIFKTLLKDTPSYMCNEVNLLYALTVTAKLYPSSLEGEKSKRNESSQETTRLRNEFKSLLIEGLETLSNIISSGSQHELSLRQYANAAWAIVRHQVKNSALDFNNDEVDEDSERNRAATTVEDLLKNIERKIVHELLHNNNKRGEEKKSPKPAELCMISSAYASKEPRDCPVGWRTVSGYQTNFPISSSSDISYSVINFDDNAGISIDKQDVAEESISSTLVDQLNMSKTSSTNSLFEIIAKTILDSKQNTPDGDENKLVEYDLLRQSSWKELSNLAWSFATHDFINPTEPKPLSNNVYSFIEALATEATERLSSSSSVHDVSSSAMQPRDLSLLAWSLGMLQVVDFRLGDSFVNYINALETHLFSSSSHPFSRWNCTDLIQLAVSLAHGRLDNQKILLALYDEALHKIFASEEKMEHKKKKKKDDTFESWELSVLVWVQAKLYLTGAIDETYETFSNHVPTVIMERLQSSSDLSQIGIGPKEQANLAWSLAVLQTYQHPDSIRLLQSIFDQPFSIADGEQWPEHLHQLHQALFVLSDECPEATKYVKNEYRDYLLENWINEKSRIKTSSARHKALSQTLSLMRVAHYNEHDEDIDVAIVLKDTPTSSARSSLHKGRNKEEVKPKWTHMATTTSDKTSNSKGQDYHDESNVSHKVAVEFDGPNHFTRIIQDEESSQHNTTPNVNGSNSPRVLGHTVLKYRMLKIKGWTVVRVPFYEFDKIPFWASMERQRYLQRALKTHANIKFSQVDISEYKPHVVHSRKSRFD
eukprot:CAMPEP_0178943840 /NCGR_PEP_ID=MMETSP0789-20121207/2812_1 /TAXON_ID=3005 /ORGANISM="Rhizosolenia setigera, Strain CCMP 1694" /LENGTH=983 /DNA_ID=CAMNT_0020623483 /DNA_START=98 /DNA_END=3049 /DNA_ORIENTATION=-